MSGSDWQRAWNTLVYVCRVWSTNHSQSVDRIANAKRSYSTCIRDLQPITLTFGDRHAREIEDNLTDLDDYSKNGSYQPSESSDDDNDGYNDDNYDNEDDDYASNEPEDIGADDDNDNAKGSHSARI